jgi:hypothetical protein
MLRLKKETLYHLAHKNESSFRNRLRLAIFKHNFKISSRRPRLHHQFFVRRIQQSIRSRFQFQKRLSLPHHCQRTRHILAHIQLKAVIATTPASIPLSVPAPTPPPSFYLLDSSTANTSFGDFAPSTNSTRTSPQSPSSPRRDVHVRSGTRARTGLCADRT